MHPLLKDKKVIFFDAGYTLDKPTSGDWFFINKFLEIAGQALKAYDPKDIKAARDLAYDYLEKNHLILTMEEEKEAMTVFYRLFSDKLGLGLSEEEIDVITTDRTYNMDNYTAYPDAKQVLEVLSKDFTLGVISDTWPSIVPQLKHLGLMEYFSFGTYSCFLGVTKPDLRMYQDALEKAGCDPKETVFIDDRPANLAAAEKMGITPILIAAEPGTDTNCPYEKIDSLTELIQE